MTQQAPNQRELILVVDDSEEIRNFLVQYVLAPMGYQTITAGDGLEGLQMAVAQKPDLMIVDVQMPYMSGLELLRRLRQRRLHIPAVLATAHGSEQVAVEAFRLGVRDYVIKPFIIEEIQEIIERALRESRLEMERDQLVRQLTRVNRRLRQQAQEVNALYGIGKSVSSSLQIEKVLERVIEAAVYLSDAEEGAIMLIDEQKGDLYVRASKNMQPEAEKLRLEMQDSIAGRVLRNKQTAILSQWDLYEAGATIPERQKRSYVYIPMVSRGRPLGLLAVANRVESGPFNNREARVLSALASYAAIAITNAMLYDRSVKEWSQLSTIINQTDDPVLVIDDDHRMILVNEAARKEFDLPAGQLAGQPVASLIHNQDVVAFMTQPAGAEMSRHVQIETESNRLFDAGLSPIKGVGRSVILHDITQLYEINQLKSDIVSAVSHDLRSPLTAILGYVELLERAGPLNELQRSFVTRVAESVHKITSFITELLDVDRLEEGAVLRLEPCSLEEIIQSVVETYQLPIKNKQQRLQVKLEPGLQVLADNNRLYQAFSNILSNAHKYTAKEGQITITSRFHERQAIIEFKDNGIGISARDQARIFEKYYRGTNTIGDFQGTGLGLYIVKSIVEGHDGRIWLRSETGKGTHVVVMLPIYDATPAESKPSKK